MFLQLIPISFTSFKTSSLVWPLTFPFLLRGHMWYIVFSIKAVELCMLVEPVDIYTCMLQITLEFQYLWAEDTLICLPWALFPTTKPLDTMYMYLLMTLKSTSNVTELLLWESLLIKKYKPSLKTNIGFTLLCLFWYLYFYFSCMVYQLTPPSYSNFNIMLCFSPLVTEHK